MPFVTITLNTTGTSALTFEDVKQTGLDDLMGNENKLENNSSYMELINNFGISQNSNGLQNDRLNLENVLPNQNYDINFQENVAAQRSNDDKNNIVSLIATNRKNPELAKNFLIHLKQ